MSVCVFAGLDQGSHFRPHFGEVEGIGDAAEEAEGGSDGDGFGGADAVGRDAGQDGPGGAHTHEQHGIDAHDAAPEVFGNHGLDEGVGGS